MHGEQRQLKSEGAVWRKVFLGSLLELFHMEIGGAWRRFLPKHKYGRSPSSFLPASYHLIPVPAYAASCAATP